ncbi:unnamed protein product, partial [Tuber aestivum]
KPPSFSHRRPFLPFFLSSFLRWAVSSYFDLLTVPLPCLLTVPYRYSPARHHHDHLLALFSFLVTPAHSSPFDSVSSVRVVFLFLSPSFLLSLSLSLRCCNFLRVEERREKGEKRNIIKKLYEPTNHRDSGSDKAVGVMSLEAKVVVLGTQGVGKTSLVVRYVKNTFDPASESTIGASFLAKRVVVDDCLVRLQIWVITPLHSACDDIYAGGCGVMILTGIGSPFCRTPRARNATARFRNSTIVPLIVGFFATTLLRKPRFWRCIHGLSNSRRM